MNKFKVHVFVLAALAFMTLAHARVEAQQELIAYADRAYVKQERLNPDDWVVEFSLPSEAQVRLVFCAAPGSEQVLFDRSGVSYQPGPNGRKLVVVTAGGLARFRTGYKGTVQSWARTLRVRYVLFRPRGPEVGPRRP